MNPFNNILLVKKYKALYFFAVLFFLWLMPSCNKMDKLQPVPAATSAKPAQISAGQNPNIIIFLADDIGYDALPADGNGTFETPNIDKMVSAGMRFTQCHTAPLCTPSRFLLMSSRYNFRNYNNGSMDPNEKTFGNLLKDAGYATYVAGKWSVDGGDNSIHSFGFNNYIVWDPIQASKPGNIYKAATLYTHAAYMNKNITADKYDNDIYIDSILTFIKDNKSTNFFAYVPFTLTHGPYSPTPDDPEFATWVSDPNNSDNKYFPSMVKYMDKKVGQVIDSLKAWNLYNNTIVMFTGDNGTPKGIYYYYNGEYITGSKDKSTEAGTKVPLVVTWPSGITAGSINRDMVSFVDFMPTLGDAAGVKIPESYGVRDGQSFYPQLRGWVSTPRDWLFCELTHKKRGVDVFSRWAQDTTYKLYDTLSDVGGKFFNVVKDPDEKLPLKNLTPDEKAIKSKFQNILDSLH